MFYSREKINKIHSWPIFKPSKKRETKRAKGIKGKQQGKRDAREEYRRLERGKRKETQRCQKNINRRELILVM